MIVLSTGVMIFLQLGIGSVACSQGGLTKKQCTFAINDIVTLNFSGIIDSA
jgi:hypothetical protein